MGGRSRVRGAWLPAHPARRVSDARWFRVRVCVPSAVRRRQLECETDRSPYADVPGADLTAEVHTSNDADPVRYVRWSGTVPSFDGLPLSVAVTVPCEAPDGALPAIAMLHGFTDDKTIWEETGRSDTVESVDRPGANSRGTTSGSPHAGT